MKTEKLRWSLFDPTGNLTALVESAVEPERQPFVAAELMRLCPAAEQVGFVRFDAEPPALRMAGGEFCGNAAMSAAALYCLRVRETEALRLCVSGAAEPVEVRLSRAGEDRFAAQVSMPPPLDITRVPFALGDVRGDLTLVRMQGISHLIIPEASPFFALCADRPRAERAVKTWCGELAADCLGLMFLSGEGAARSLTPLVVVPASGTVFWESSCASGSAAVGMALAAESGSTVELTMQEPGGSLAVRSDPNSGMTLLRGTTRLIQTEESEISEV